MSDKRKEIWETLDSALAKFVSNAYATGQSDERERILELLTDFDNEKYYEWLKSDNQDWPDYAQTAIGLRLAIALIKGVKNGNV
jgi:hypothetical protein